MLIMLLLLTAIAIKTDIANNPVIYFITIRKTVILLSQLID